MANLQRRNTALAAACCYFVSIIFLILVLIGNTHIKPVLTEIYFFKLDVSDIIPLSVENAQFLNSIARSLGLHDFYQVGLWNFCEGYRNEGITDCSKPERLFWFNPVQVLMSELLAGAKIALPSQVNTILNLLRIGQQITWGFFITGTVVNTVLLLATPLVLRSRIWSLPFAVGAFISGLCINAAAAIATIITVGAKYALTAQDQLNIRVDVGVRMFVFMWLAGSLSTVAFILHAAMGCFCLPSKQASNKADASPGSPSSPLEHKKHRFPSFRRRKVAGSS